MGEAGDNIGRGGRSSIFFIDEAAHLERPQLIDASLASNTDCRIDISSVNGLANSFAQRRHSGRFSVFTFHWRHDPRKGDAWYQHQKATLDPVVLGAEVDLDYRASSEGVLIPSSWIASAVDAHKKLNITPTGIKRAGLDIADEGRDANALAGRHGILLEALESWSGKDRDIFSSVVRAFSLCDQWQYPTLFYDADGMGAGVRGDARVLNEQRALDGRQQIADEPFRGSAAPESPEDEMIPGRKNQDYFANLKAMSWMALRMRFLATHRALTEGEASNPDDLISLASTLPELPQLLQELSQPTYSLNLAGKVLIHKSPAGAASPQSGGCGDDLLCPRHGVPGDLVETMNGGPAAMLKSFRLRRLWAAAHREAVQVLALSGPQITALVGKANPQQALDLARLECAFQHYAVQLRGLAAMCEQAAGHLAAGLSERPDLRSAARKPYEEPNAHGR